MAVEQQQQTSSTESAEKIASTRYKGVPITNRPPSYTNTPRGINTIVPIKFQRFVQIASWVGGPILVFYLTFYHDFGHTEHCFKQPRIWYDRQVKRFLTLTPDDRSVLSRLGKVKNEQQEQQQAS